MSIAKTIGRNWKKNTSSNALGDSAKKGLWALLGGSLYWLLPTAIQGFGKVDMSGLKGVITGVVGAGLIGIASDKKEIIAGGITAGGVHLTYNHLNDTVTNVFSSPIFGYGQGSVQYADTGYSVDGQPVSDGTIPEGYAVNGKGELIALDTPDGGTLTAQTESVPAETVGDYTDTLNGKAFGLPSPVSDNVDNVGAIKHTPGFNPSRVRM